MAEQVIEVPKISCSPCPSRSLIPEPQSAEQLVEAPTVLPPLRIAEQIVGIPVPRGQRRILLANAFLSGLWSRSSISQSRQTVEQIVDISPRDGFGLGSTSSAGAADGEFTGVFALFPWKKCGKPGRW